MAQIIVTAYGKRGIHLIDENSREVIYLPVEGKCNFCIQNEGNLYVPVQADHNFIYEYDSEYRLSGKYQVQHFYSHGVFFEGKLFLASFSEGVDAVYDLKEHRETDIFKHSRNGYKGSGRSHFIDVTPDRNYIYSVDNAFQQIYIYDVSGGKLKVHSIMEFTDENIRLMPYSSFSGCAYLNTEVTNRIYTLKYDDGQYHIQNAENMKTIGKCFSGGNAVSDDGKHLCISLRGDDRLLYYRLESDGGHELISDIKCGSMPRDVMIRQNRIYVTCTYSDAIEVYSETSAGLKKIDEFSVDQPVTFGRQR